MTIRKTYYPLAGQTEVTDASITYVQPLMVSRSGMLFNLTDNDALLLNGGLFYQYSPSLGSLIFGFAFNQGEDIEIVYKTI